MLLLTAQTGAMRCLFYIDGIVGRKVNCGQQSPSNNCVCLPIIQPSNCAVHLIIQYCNFVTCQAKTRALRTGSPSGNRPNSIKVINRIVLRAVDYWVTHNLSNVYIRRNWPRHQSLRLLTLWCRNLQRPGRFFNLSNRARLAFGIPNQITVFRCLRCCRSSRCGHG